MKKFSLQEKKKNNNNKFYVESIVPDQFGLKLQQHLELHYKKCVMKILVHQNKIQIYLTTALIQINESQY
jgi:hypothetical protein